MDDDNNQIGNEGVSVIPGRLTPVFPNDGGDRLTEEEGQWLKQRLEENAAKKQKVKDMLRKYEMVNSEGAAKVLMNEIIQAIDGL